VFCAFAGIQAGGFVLHLVLAHPTVSNMQAVSSWMVGVHQAQQFITAHSTAAAKTIKNALGKIKNSLKRPPTAAELRYLVSVGAYASCTQHAQLINLQPVTQLLQKHAVSAQVVAELQAFTTIMPGSQATTLAALATTAPLEETVPMLLQQLGGCIHSTLVVVSYCKLNGPTFDWSTSCRSSQQSNSKFDCRITISMLTCPLLQKTSVGF
jgi:hypothetical protein